MYNLQWARPLVGAFASNATPLYSGFRGSSRCAALGALYSRGSRDSRLSRFSRLSSLGRALAIRAYYLFSCASYVTP